MDGRTIAVVAAYVDLTEQRQNFFGTILPAAASLCLLTSLAFTTAGLAVAGWLAPSSLAVQVGALLVATGLAGLVRFVLLRAWVFRAHRRSATALPGR